MTERILIMLVNLSWHLGLIFAAAWLILVIFRVRSASARRIIWMAVVLSPLIMLPMNIISSDIVIIRTGSSQSEAEIAPLPNPNTVETESAEYLHNIATPSEEKALDSPVSSQPEIGSVVSIKPSEPSRFNLINLLISIWLLGVCVSFIIISAGYIRLRRLISRAHEIGDENVIRVFREAGEEIGLRRDVRLLSSKEARTPFSAGFFHPGIILPDRMSRSEQKLKMIITHEMVHLKQFDDLLSLMRQIIGAFVFFHPFFHLAVKELQISGEQVCDGWVIKLTGARDDYADCLVEFTRACAGRLPICLGRNGNSMTRRVKSVLNGKEVFKMIGRKSSMLLIISISLLILIASVPKLVGCASSGKATSEKDIVENSAAMVSDSVPETPHTLKLRVSAPEPGKLYGEMALGDRIVSQKDLAEIFGKESVEMLIIESGRNVPSYQIARIMDIAKLSGNIPKIGFAMVPETELADETISPEEIQERLKQLEQSYVQLLEEYYSVYGRLGRVQEKLDSQINEIRLLGYSGYQQRLAQIEQNQSPLFKEYASMGDLRRTQLNTLYRQFDEIRMLTKRLSETTSRQEVPIELPLPFEDQFHNLIMRPDPNGISGQQVRNRDFESGLDGWRKQEDFGDTSIKSCKVVYDEDIGSNVVQFERTNGGVNGTYIGISQDAYIDLSQYDDVRLKLDVKPIFHSLQGGGGWGAPEYPVVVEIAFIDQRGHAHVWNHGFYYSSESLYDNATKVSANAWYTYTSPNLKEVEPVCSNADIVEDCRRWNRGYHTYMPPVVPAYITKVLIFGHGWDYMGRADNIEFILQ